MRTNAKGRDESGTPVKTLYPESGTAYPHARNGMAYKCPSAGCKRWDLKYLGLGIYVCRDCKQRWRVDQ
jgi:hypothetical protein